MIRALLELDLRYARNQAATIARSPARLLIWLPYLVLFAYVFAWRMNDMRHAHGIINIPGPTDTFATLAGAAFLTALGFAIARHAGGRVEAFRCNAEAVLCANAGVSPVILIFWLQMRRLIAAAPRWFGALVFFVAAFAPEGSPADALARVIFGSVCAALALALVELPAYLAGRKRFGEAVVIGGWVLALFGGVQLLCAVAVLLDDGGIAQRILTAVTFDPGRLVLAVVNGDPISLAASAAIPLILGLAVGLVGRDALPELYEGTLRAQGHVFERTASLVPLRTSETRAPRIPAGSLALVWKDWTVLRRRGGTRTLILGAGFWAAFGAAIAFAVRPESADTGLALALLAIATLFITLVPIAVSTGLADDIAKPMWWLAPAPLHTRLATWTLSRSWPGGAALAALPFVLGLALDRPKMAIFALPASLLLWWSLHALGLALYSAFPSRFDLRGPFGMLRIAAAVIFLTPPFWAFAAIGIAAGNMLAGGLVASAILALEGYAGLAAAVRRIDQNGAMLATLERAG